MIYDAYQAHADAMWPIRSFAALLRPSFVDTGFEAFSAFDPGGVMRGKAREMAAACDVLALAEVRHRRPAFGIASVMVADRPVAVVEEVVASTPFATLLKFAKPGVAPQPRLLIVAPMSGHFATLLRDTIRTALPDHEVYVTDWHNARDVPLSAGRFGLEEYTDHLIDFLGAIGPGAHMAAICQPCVSSLCAVALMSEDEHPATPRSLTLMAGPIDCRISPTEVNKLAMTKDIDWFRKNLISHVPARLPGAGRRVYPGFMQLSAFMSMNRERHVNAFKSYYENLVAGETEKAKVTQDFYEEYLAVSDLPAEFFLETVDQVFQRHSLPRGELMHRGRRIDPAKIRRTALLTVEGERDDICAIGQTLAAQDLCARLKPFMRTHYVQPGVGHYGVFSGRRWQTQIYPVLREVVHVSD